MSRSLKTSPHILLYFDILGYKSLLRNKSIDENYIIHVIKDLNDRVKALGKRGKLYKALLFSDNCVLCYPLKDIIDRVMLFDYVVACAQHIQRNMLLQGFFLRGSICIGDIYINNNYVFGEGIIKAYELENSVAIYPRIIVDSELVDSTISFLEIAKEGKYISVPEKVVFPEVINERNMFNILCELNEVTMEYRQFYNSIKVQRDFDGQYFVDVLNNVFSECNIEDIEQIDLSKSVARNGYELYGTDNSDITGINWGLCTICTNVLKAYKNNIEMPRIKSKYLWFCHYINRFFNEVGLEEPFSPQILEH